jgi:hypothetical protein
MATTRFNNDHALKGGGQMATAEKARRVRTTDRGPPERPLGGEATRPLEVGTIGPNRSFLPDGSLLLRNVPIARTGWMQYAQGEVPLDPPKGPASTPVIYVHRGPEDLFNEETMRSFIGAAVTHQHPPVNVTPENFDHLGKGFILRTYRGDGADDDLLMADIVVKDKWTIDYYGLDRPGEVNCEVSCGYEATYVQTGDGQGKQTNIIGNHLALVPKGRCGPRCAIGDEDTFSSTNVNEETMTTQQTPGKRARVPLADARARVADALADLETAEAEESKGVTVHVHLGGQEQQPAATTTTSPADEGQAGATAATVDAAVEERFTKIEKAQAEQGTVLQEILKAVKEGKAPATSSTADADPEVITEATATMDSAALGTSYQQLLSDAEILVPGFKLPTFDAALKRAATVDRMCNCRRSVLAAVAATKDGAPLLAKANGGAEFDVVGSDCKVVATVFKAAATAKKESNNRSSTGDSGTVPQQPAQKPAMSFAAINEANKKFWSSQGPRA